MTRLIRDEEHLCRVLDIPFSEEQLGAITSPSDVPSVIIAGAGSGKTTVMAARVVWLVGHEEVAPASVLGLTFTNKAAAELGLRVRASLQLLADDARLEGFLEEEGEPTVSTYNAFAGTLIAEHGLRLGFETDLTITSDASRFQRAARAVERYRGPLVHVSTSMPDSVQGLLSLDGALNEHLVTPDELRAHDAAVIDEILRQPRLIGDLQKGIDAANKRIELSRLVDAYRAAKESDGVMDFSDQMSRGARLGIECPEVSSIMRERFGTVMLDEYQDTSVAQRLMLQGLFSGHDVADGRGHCVTAVGDPTQSIYGWRGAAADNLPRFLEHFPDRDGQMGRSHQLQVSRRCEADILDLANTVAKPYYDDNDAVFPLLPAAAEPRGHVVVSRHDSVATEVVALADAVQEAAGRLGAGQVAILVRKRDEMGTVTAALRSRGVPVEVVGLDGLLAQPEIVEIVSMLEVVADAAANPSMLRILTSARWRIGPRDLALLGQRAHQLAAGLRVADPETLAARLGEAVAGTDPTDVISLSDAVDDPGHGAFSADARLRFREISALVRSLRRAANDPLVDLVHQVVRRLGIDVEVALGQHGELAGDNIALLGEAASRFNDAGESTSLVAFLAYLRAEEDFNRGMSVAVPSESDSVKLMTIHKSKGLEWTCVFVPFLADGVFPSSKTRDRWTSNGTAFPVPLRGDADSQPRLGAWSGPELKKLTAQFKADALSEDLRLAYVALTRAKSELHLSGHWWGRTQVKPREASPYLDLAHEWALEHGQAVGLWADPPEPAEDGSWVNPHGLTDPVMWPPLPPQQTARHVAADHVRALMRGEALEIEADGPTDADLGALERLSVLDDEIGKLVAEAAEQRDRLVVPLPSVLSATQAMALADDPSAFARELARPMPRRPSPAARFGTRFHAWVEAHFGQQALLDPTDLPGRADPEISTDSDLADLTRAFADGPYGDSAPHAIEAPFSIVLGGQQVIGRIDAVYRTSTGFEVVDWKTNQKVTADPLQLAIYRLAWAELNGLDPADVTGAFYYVRRGEVHRHDDLPGRAELERRLGLGGTD